MLKEKKKKGEWAMEHISSKFYNQIGYVNCIVRSNLIPGIEGYTEENPSDFTLACENGVYFGQLNQKFEFELSKEVICEN